MAKTTKPKLKKDLQQFLDNLHQLRGMTIRGHKNPDGDAVYRVLDEHFNPVCNLNKSRVDKLVALGKIHIKTGFLCIN